VLESKKVAWNASGRNAGFVAPGFSERIENIVQRVGLAQAKELWGLSVAGVEYVRATMREAGIEAEAQGRLTVSRRDCEDELLRTAAMLRVDLGAAVEPWSTEQVRDVLRSRRYFQALHWPDAFAVQPRRYAMALAAAAEQAGARIFEQTPAMAVDSAGVRKRVDTPKARVRAGHVVLAGGAHLGPAFGPVSDTLLPLSSYLGVTEPLGEALSETVRYLGAVSDARRGGDYYRIVDRDRLLWGSRISTRTATPAGLDRMLQNEIRSVYPQLENVKIEEAWAGLMAYAVHKMPLIGEITPGLWIAAGFGGHGINTTAMAGDLIASAMVEGDDRWRLFSCYELVWTGGSWGRVGAQVLFWAKQIGDTVAEALSRRREQARRVEGRRAARAALERERQLVEDNERRAKQQAAREMAEDNAERFAAAQRVGAGLEWVTRAEAADVQDAPGRPRNIEPLRPVAPSGREPEAGRDAEKALEPAHVAATRAPTEAKPVRRRTAKPRNAKRS
jgi:glycine/D-amino acid oxidase-like deaminating enzyme